MLCAPTYEAICRIKALQLPVVEIGAGDGSWVRALRQSGVSVQGWDIEPRGADVRKGDHLAAADGCSAILAVWPPDGSALTEWVQAAAWKALVIVGSWARFEVCLDGYATTHILTLPPGSKGGSEMRVLHPEAAP